ncbi:hypothetical protein M3G18_03185 [Corynebacterium sp. p3-SID1145]|uniref:hypothetical protein n=1 Tax=unclassified Corynebacterium TaxID=2624378 RepID=UPI0021AB017C|nr:MULTISPECIES: hypothetical protein [unclassified Corynebacterium]MCT1451919.1 hypothetical protein [Corynebacterium sp. p3-SID1145]MCT1461106.1 hypothetical protein [Corynebacterium sp. p3-SID1140]
MGLFGKKKPVLREASVESIGEALSALGFSCSPLSTGGLLTEVNGVPVYIVDQDQNIGIGGMIQARQSAGEDLNWISDFNNRALWPVVFRAEQPGGTVINAEHRIIKGVEYSDAQLREEAELGATLVAETLLRYSEEHPQ